MAERVLVAGGTGYLGSRLVPRLVRTGRAVRVLARGDHGPKGAELVRGDLADPASLERALAGVDTVFHLVGIIKEGGGRTFRSVHVDGTRALVEAAAKAGVRRFLYVSAIGARPDAPTAYWRTKAEAEKIVRASGLSWIVLRPSIVFAPDGEIYKVLQQLTAFPIVPILGPGTSKLAPIRADDLADAEVAALDRPDAWNRVHEAAGPEALTFDELVRRVARARGKSVTLVHVPLALARPLVAVVSKLPFAPITSDQLAMLSEDSVADPTALTAAFGVTPRSIEPLLDGRERAA
jgi:NADH dehydrogenase